MPKHSKPSTPEGEIAAGFGAELHALCKSLGWDDPKQLGDLVGYSYKTIYKAWNTGLVSWDCVKAIITNLYENQLKSPDRAVELWYEKWRATRAQIDEARASFDTRLTEVVEESARTCAHLDELRLGHDSLLSRIEALERRALFGNGQASDATLHLEPVPRRREQTLEEFERYVAWAEQEARRKREESQEAAWHAERLETWEREARCYLAQFLPPAETTGPSAREPAMFPDQRTWQE